MRPAEPGRMSKGVEANNKIGGPSGCHVFKPLASKEGNQIDAKRRLANSENTADARMLRNSRPQRTPTQKP